MKSRQARIAWLVALSSGTLLQSSCDVTDAILGTIDAALRIVDIWV